MKIKKTSSALMYAVVAIFVLVFIAIAASAHECNPQSDAIFNNSSCKCIGISVPKSKGDASKLEVDKYTCFGLSSIYMR